MPTDPAVTADTPAPPIEVPIFVVIKVTALSAQIINIVHLASHVETRNLLSVQVRLTGLLAQSIG